jgi:hypothetical protein
MPASDAAPLPRLGEVFFDVRGSSRSMRLSWYADTGVAVFSIWQGGMCTGTFRLPMDDLSRMIEILQRGPERSSQRPVASADLEHRPGGRGRADYRDPPRGEPDYGEPDYGDADYGDSDHSAAAFPAADYGDAGYGDSGYADSGYRDSGYASSGYADSGYGPGEQHGGDYGDYGPAGHRSAVQPDATGQRYVPAGEAGYGQQRFVPPYVRGQGESYVNDNPAGRTDDRRGMGDLPYPADPPGDSLGPDRYPEPQRPQGGFPADSEYRLPADPDAGTRHSAGKHSSRRPGTGERRHLADADTPTAGNRTQRRD